MDCILNQLDLQSETNQGSDNRLSILLSQGGFSFMISHPVQQNIIQLGSYKFTQFEFRKGIAGQWPVNGKEYFELLKTVEALQQSYNKIEIAVASPKITIAPNNFLESGSGYDLVAAAHPISANEAILKESFATPGPVTAIVIPDYIISLADSFFPGSRLRCAAAVLVKGVLRKHSESNDRQVFANIHNDFFEITVIQGSRLLYLNAFRFLAPSDILYYLVFVLEQLGFVPSEENITLMGLIDEEETLTSHLKLYFASIRYADAPEEINVSETFADVKAHNYFTLFNIPLCE